MADDGAQRGEDRLAQRGAAGGVQPVDRGDGLVVVVGRAVGGQRALVEGDHTDVDGVGLCRDEPVRRAWAAASRLGFTSAAVMLFDTSNGEDHGPGHTRHGTRSPEVAPARAAAAPERPGKRAAGTCRRSRPGPAVLSPAAASAVARSRCSRRYASTKPTQTTAATTSRAGYRKLISAAASDQQARSCPPAFRPAHHVDQRRDQVLVGADRGTRSPRPGASTTSRPVRGPPPRRVAAAGRTGRRCRRTVARRSRRPRSGPGRGRAGRPRSGRRRGRRPPRAGAPSRLERRLPVDVADEVGDDEDQAAPAGGGRGQVAAWRPDRCGARPPATVAALGQLVGQAQDVIASGPRRDDPLGAVVVQDGADSVAGLRRTAGRGRSRAR